MGGSIAIIYRRPNGEVISRIKWTNCMPELLSDLRLFEKDDAWFMDFMSEGNVYREGKSEEFVQMPIAPSEYGIIVVDFMQNVLLDWNHYTTVGVLGSTWFNQPDMYSGSDEVTKHTKKLFGAKRVREILILGPERKTVNVQDMDWDQFIATLDAINNYCQCALDMSPFSVERFHKMCNTKEKEISEMFRCKTRMEELGFVFSPEDEQIWKDYHNEQ